MEYKNCCGAQPTKEIYIAAFWDVNFSLRCVWCFMKVSAPIHEEAYKLANAWNCLANGKES